MVLYLFCNGLIGKVLAQDANPGGNGPNYLSNANPYYQWDYANHHSTSDPHLIYQCTWYVWGRAADAGWILNAAPGADTEYSAITNGSCRESSDFQTSRTRSDSWLA